MRAPAARVAMAATPTTLSVEPLLTARVAPPTQRPVRPAPLRRWATPRAARSATRPVAPRPVVSRAQQAAPVARQPAGRQSRTRAVMLATAATPPAAAL